MKLVTINKLNRLWKKGIVTKLSEKLDKTRVLTSTEQVQANTNAENVVGALVAKELINDLTDLTDGGAITGMQVREDGVYIAYVPSAGADSVTKKLGSGSKCTFTITATQSGASERGDNYYGRVNGTTSVGVVVDFEAKTVAFKSRSQTGTLTYRHGKDPEDGPWSASVTGSQSISNVSWE